MSVSYPVIYTDSQGVIVGRIRSDGRGMRMWLSDAEFEGTDFDSFEMVSGADPAGRFTFASADLCACSLAFEIPITMMVDGEDVQATLGAHLHLGRPRPDGGIDAETLR